MRAARIMSCAVLLGVWAANGAAAPPASLPRQAKPAKGSVIDNSQRIDGNNVSMVVTNTGSFAFDKATGNSGLEFPKGTGKTAVFAAGLWVGARVAGTTRVAIAEYSDEYGPGSAAGGVPDNPDLPEYKVYKLNRVYADPVVRDAVLADYNGGAVPHGAPAVSVNTDGTLGGGMLGDQMTWAVYNDLDPVNHTNRAGSTAPLGVEVQQTTFAFNRVGALGNTVFIKYKFINRGTNVLDSMFVSQWSDPDLGGFTDDLVGCDIGLGLGYVYNATNGDAQYGSSVPAVGYDFFQGPAGLPMTSFNKYINGTDPNTAQKSFNYMKGLDADGNDVINPVTGQQTLFQVSGDPVTNTGWLDTNPADRRLMLSSGPFTMAPGDAQEVVAAIVIGQSTNRLGSISLMKFYDASAQSAFEQGFNLASPPNNPVVRTTPQNGAVLLTWDTSSEDYSQVPYVWEGYVVYQGASIAGPFTKIATYDVQDGIQTVLDPDFDEQSGVVLPKVKALGTDAGVRRDIRLTQDYVRGGPLHSGTPYYFAVTAYAVGLGSVPQVLESAPNVIRVVPQGPAAEVDWSAAGIASGPTYAQINNTQLAVEDSLQVAVVDSDQMVNASYRVGFKPDANGTPTWYLVRTVGAAVDTVINNWSNFAGDENFPVIDGVKVKNFGAKFRQLGDAFLDNVGANPAAIGGVDVGLTFFGHSTDYAWNLFGSKLDPANGNLFNTVEVRFGPSQTQKAYRYMRSATTPRTYLLQDFVDVPWTVWDVESNRQLNSGWLENQATANGVWDPSTDDAALGNREIIWPMASTYSATADPFYSDPVRNDALNLSGEIDFQYALWPFRLTDDGTPTGNPIPLDDGDKFVFQIITGVRGAPTTETENDYFTFTTTAPNRSNTTLAQSELARVKAVPNPYFNHSSYELNQFNRQLKFTHLPVRCTIRLFNLAGDLIRTLEKNDPSSQLTWDLETSRGLPVGSGIYIFHVDAPGIGTHVGKVAVFMEKERLNNF